MANARAQGWRDCFDSILAGNRSPTEQEGNPLEKCEVCNRELKEEEEALIEVWEESLVVCQECEAKVREQGKHWRAR